MVVRPATQLTALILVLSLALVACTGGSTDATTTSRAATTTTAPRPTTSVATAVTEPAVEGPDLYLMLMWNHHQPRYPLDENGAVTRPWTRLHATKDYLDMAATVAQHPEVSVVFNLTPTLLLQLEEFAGGAKDAYWAAAEISAAELSDADKRFLLERFFDTNRGVVARFPRYQELLDLRDRAGGPEAAVDVFGEQDYRDLQILFNLAWTDPDLLATEPLADLVARGRDFTEDDKPILFAEHLRILQEVVPRYAALWETGQIEVTTSPLAHPILPLLSDTALAAVGDPSAIVPDEPFRQPTDAEQQVVRGLDVAERLLGRRPAGMWPGEGAVAQAIMPLFSDHGVQWVASGEQALAPSLGIGSFTRDAGEVVQEADLLYRPWQAEPEGGNPVPIFFRDSRLSDRIGFEYSEMAGTVAAADFMGRLRDIRNQLAASSAADPDRPFVVSVILDGENAWEHYADDGKGFLNALYANLSEAGFVETITPSEYLARFGVPEGLEEVFPAAWFQSSFATWIGEDEEATAWDYLAAVRKDLAAADASGDHTADQLAAAYESILLAEGSDWFWWFGSDQESGDDAYFDRAYRELLAGVYLALEERVPVFVGIPIIPAPAATAAAVPEDLITPTIDFAAGTTEWADAGRYDEPATGPVEGVWYGYDRQNLYVRVDFGEEVLGNDDVGFELYLGPPAADEARETTLRGTLLGFGARAMIEWNGANPITACFYAALPPIGHEEDRAACRAVAAGFDGDSVELAVPLRDLGSLETGDRLALRVVSNDVFRDIAVYPASGPAVTQVPELAEVDVLLSVEDPFDDDHGPGTYVYPTDESFTPGSYDLTRLQVGTDEGDLVITLDVRGTVENPWGSPSGLATQTFDIYVDTDLVAGTGSRLLLPGRNAALADGNGWEYGITIEGWEPAVYVAEPDGAARETTPPFDVIVFAELGRVIVRIPAALVPEGDPAGWGYAAAVMSHEGAPSPGVRRIRDVAEEAERWLAGGGPADANHTRIFDVVWPVRGEQERLLGDYPPVTAGTEEGFAPDEVGVVPLLLAG